MTSPIAMQQTIMFDGLLAYAYFQEHGPITEKSVGHLSIENKFDFTPMPIKLNNDGYFMASWLFYDQTCASEQVHTSLKKWDEASDYMSDFGKSKRQVAIDRGEFKTTQIPLRIINTPTCWFYFQSDNVNEVEYLINKHITGIGKKISRGYGFFSKFDIEPCNNIFEEKIIRPIPVKNIDMQNMNGIQRYEYRAWKPPYWLPENFTICRVE